MDMTYEGILKRINYQLPKNKTDETRTFIYGYLDGYLKALLETKTINEKEFQTLKTHITKYKYRSE